MRWFTGHKIIKEGEGYTILLYLDNHLTEFAREFNEVYRRENKSLERGVRDYIGEKLPELRVNSVKVMMGSLQVASFSLGNGD